MKFNRKQIEEQNLSVWVSDQDRSPSSTRALKFPEEVDTTSGSISFWTVPSQDQDTLLAERRFTSESAKVPPNELDLVLKKETNKHVIIIKPIQGRPGTHPQPLIIAETGVLGDEAE